MLVCLGFTVAMTVAVGELRAEPLCEPDLRPELCVPGVSTSPECQIQGPVGAPSAGGILLLAAPELVLPVSLPAPAPDTARRALDRAALGAAHPGYARRIDRPPQQSA